MDFESVFKLADNIEGSFVEAGFGKGRTADTILGLMKEGKIIKRFGYLLDLFESVTIQPAFDRRFVLPGYDIKVLKGDVADTLIQVDRDIAIAHIDLDNKPGIKSALRYLNGTVVKDGIIAISFPNIELKQFTLDLIKEEKIEFKIRESEDLFLYLQNINPPVKFDTKLKKDRTEVNEVRVKQKKTNTLTATSKQKGKHQSDVKPAELKGKVIATKVTR